MDQLSNCQLSLQIANCPNRQQELIENLQIFFSKPTLKILPYVNLFQSNTNPHLFCIFNLKYLHQFMTTSTKNHVNVLLQMIKGILNEKQAAIKQIVKLKSLRLRILSNAYKKSSNIVERLFNLPIITYLSRFLSLAAQYMNISSTHSTQFSINYQREEKELIQSILKYIEEFEEEDQIYILNKLVILGKQRELIQILIKFQKICILLKNIKSLTKKHKILQSVYITFLENRSENHLKLLNQLLQSNDFSENVVSLLSINEDIYSQDKYIVLFDIFCSKEQIKKLVWQDLMKWWSVGRNYLISNQQSKFRCNLLGYLIQHTDQSKLMKDGHLIYITTGIQKRLIDPQYKSFAMLIWKIMAKKMNLSVDLSIQKAQYFEIQKISTEIHLKQQITSDKIEKQEIKSVQIESQPQPLNLNDSEEQDKNQIKNDQPESDVITIKLKEPKNIYDCILGLRNPHREEISLKKLPQLIKNHPEDLTLTWALLLRELLSPLKPKYKTILVAVCTVRPTDFINQIAELFFKKDSNLNQRILLMEILEEGIRQLSQNPEKHQIQAKEESSNEIYFKKVTSRYFKSDPENKKTAKQPENIRRWGHTRIAHENMLKQSENSSINSLLIVKNSDPFVNRFYQIANLLFFKIISRFQADIQDSLKKHQILVQHILKLLCVLTENIKNHYNKYVILIDISDICRRVIQQIKIQLKNSKQVESIGGTTLTLSLQLLIKISLVIDKFLPDMLLQNVKDSIITLKQLPIYRIAPLVQLAQSNFYRNMSLSRDEI